MAAPNALKILIVDDHVTYRKSMAIMLKNRFPLSEITLAGDGSECLDILEKRSVDVVLMDIQMPVLNGIEATKRAHSLYPDLKIIGISMFGSPGERLAMMEAGAYRFHCKEDDPSILTDTIEQVFQGKK